MESLSNDHYLQDVLQRDKTSEGLKLTLMSAKPGSTIERPLPLVSALINDTVSVAVGRLLVEIHQEGLGGNPHLDDDLIDGLERLIVELREYDHSDQDLEEALTFLKQRRSAHQKQSLQPKTVTNRKARRRDRWHTAIVRQLRQREPAGQPLH